jgi:hypothetical protein
MDDLSHDSVVAVELVPVHGDFLASNLGGKVLLRFPLERLLALWRIDASQPDAVLLASNSTTVSPAITRATRPCRVSASTGKTNRRQSSARVA